MSGVKEHNNSTLLSFDNEMNPEPQVGDMVRNYYQSNQIGVVIEVIDSVQSKVLWSEYYDPYSRLDTVFSLRYPPGNQSLQEE